MWYQLCRANCGFVGDILGKLVISCVKIYKVVHLLKALAISLRVEETNGKELRGVERAAYPDCIVTAPAAGDDHVESTACDDEKYSHCVAAVSAAFIDRTDRNLAALEEAREEGEKGPVSLYISIRNTKDERSTYESDVTSGMDL